MTAINKLIEEEAINRFSQKPFRGFTDIEKTIAITEFKYGGLFILSKWQEENRWRKVEEELPEGRDGDYQVLGLLNNGEYKTIWVIKDSIPQIEVFAYHGVIEWKPIE